MDHGRHNGCLVHPTTSASGDKIDGPAADLTERAPVRCRSGALWLPRSSTTLRVIARKDGARVKLYIRPGNELTRPMRVAGPGMTLNEEEISDVSLGTFYVFDKENAGAARGQFAQRGCGGCRGCRGCRRGCGGGGCGGCGGCGCCLSWGSCRIC